jgi:hypothetical protein
MSRSSLSCFSGERFVARRPQPARRRDYRPQVYSLGGRKVAKKKAAKKVAKKVAKKATKKVAKKKVAKKAAKKVAKKK